LVDFVILFCQTFFPGQVEKEGENTGGGRGQKKK